MGQAKPARIPLAGVLLLAIANPTGCAAGAPGGDDSETSTEGGVQPQCEETPVPEVDRKVWSTTLDTVGRSVRALASLPDGGFVAGVQPAGFKWMGSTWVARFDPSGALLWNTELPSDAIVERISIVGSTIYSAGRDADGARLWTHTIDGAPMSDVVLCTYAPENDESCIVDDMAARGDRLAVVLSSMMEVEDERGDLVEEYSVDLHVFDSGEEVISDDFWGGPASVVVASDGTTFVLLTGKGNLFALRPGQKAELVYEADDRSWPDAVRLDSRDRPVLLGYALGDRPSGGVGPQLIVLDHDGGVLHEETLLGCESVRVPLELALAPDDSAYALGEFVVEGGVHVGPAWVLHWSPDQGFEWLHTENVGGFSDLYAITVTAAGDLVLGGEVQTADGTLAWMLGLDG